MFRIESYITPIIINYVDKYVKDFRPQDAQVSIFSGDVAFQNLDLRLSALEEDLDLPFKFISGHVHELSIHIPWVKLASEPIVIAINTIEFVVQLRDSNDLPPKQAVKDAVTPVQEPPPGYLASLVTKIANNINIKCNNIILKYMEEELVLSCNIQELTLSGADMNWQPAFIDISPIKFLARKLVKVNDLTICLDRRNSMGKIEICLEPILYRCSLEARLVTKYNFSTRERTSLNRIDIFIKCLDVNVSTDQFAMLKRLADLASVLPQKKSDLDLAMQRASTEEDSNVVQEQSESFVSWLWNQVPAIFPEEHESHSGSVEDEEEHILHFSVYVEAIKILFKAQEIINETVVGSIKKVRFIPLMNTECQGSFLELFRIGKTWQNTQIGVSHIKCTFVGDCTCRNPGTITEVLNFTNLNSSDTYLAGSLFDLNSPENQGMQSKYTANWTSHMELQSETKLLERASAVAIDITDYEDLLNSMETSEASSTGENNTIPKKHVIRMFVGPFCFKYCPDTVHRLTMIGSFFNAHKFPPYIEPKSASLSSSLTSVSLDEELDKLSRRLPVQLISVTLIKPSIEIHMWDHCSQGKNARKKLMRRSLDRLFFPFVKLTTERIEGHMQYPLEPKLVPILCQIPVNKISPLYIDTPYRKTSMNLFNIRGSLNFAGHSSDVLEINKLEITAKQILQPECWPENFIKLKANISMNRLALNVNPAHVCLLKSLLDSNLNTCYIDLIHTNLLADMSSQHLVHICLIVENCTASYNLTENYHVSQFEIQRINGYSSIPSLAVKTHVIQWPSSRKELLNSKSKHFLSALLQLPLHPEAVDYPPIINVKMESGAICIDNLFSRFLNYDIKRWSHEKYETNHASSKSDTAVILDTPLRRKSSIEIKRPLQAIPSVHSSSDRDAGTSMIVELEEDEQKEQNKNTFELLKHLVIQIDIEETTIYFPTKCMTHDIFNEKRAMKQNAFKDNDVVILGLPGISVLSSVGQMCQISSEKIPISLPCKYWAHGKLSFPWNIQFSDFEISTIQNEKEFQFLKPNTTNIIININDQGALSVDLHIDMKPIEMIFMVDQINFILKNFRQCMNLNLIKKLIESPKPVKPVIDFSSNSNVQMSNEIKEFLSYAQTSWLTNIKSNDSKSETRSDVTTKSSTAIPTVKGAYSLLVQFTLSKISLIILNCDAKTKCNKKFILSFEDIMINFNQRPNYHQLTVKMASGKGECFEKLQPDNEYVKNDNLGFHFHSDTDVHEKGERDTCVLHLLVTCADKIDVQTKWKVKVKPNLNSKSGFLTEVILKLQRLDAIIDLELLTSFIGAFRLDHKTNTDTELLQKEVTSVDDLPLFDFQSKGIRIFVPINGNNKNCDVFILTIGAMRMVDPENKINRKPHRPDIYQKALQLGILDVSGTKVENRQYELLFQNISLCTGNWKNVLEVLYKQKNVTHHDNPALEWNSTEIPVSNKPDVEVSKIFSGFNLGIVYAPNIIFENVLVCEEAIEFNCTNDMLLTMTLNQLVLAVQVGELYEQMMTALYPKPKPDFLVLNQMTQEYVGVSSNLFQSSPSPPKLMKAQSVDETIAKEDTFYSPGKPLVSGQLPVHKPRLQKRTLSMTHIEKRSIQDSGIESLGASHEKKRLKQKISDLKKQYQIKEIVLIPYEIYFNGGIFTLKLYKNEDEAKMSPGGSDFDKMSEKVPILSMIFDRPNVFVKQTNYEKMVKVSLLDFKLLISMEKSSQKPRNHLMEDIPIFETRPGESDHTGAKMPFIELKHLSSLTKPHEVDFKIERPVKITLSHEKLQKLLTVYVTIMRPVLEQKINKPNYMPPQSAKKTNAFKLVKTLVRGLNRLNVQVAQVLFEISDVKNYDFKLIISGFESHLNLVERIERINLNVKLQSFLLTARSQIIIHPFSLESNLTVSHESWKKEPLVILFLRSNYFQFDIHVRCCKEFLRMQHSFEHTIKMYESDLSVINSYTVATTFPKQQAIGKENERKLIPIHVSSPKICEKPKQEHYEDDLRAGAFQFIETTSTAELPLPYQIQIYQKLDMSSICWRYPQPRCLSQVKLFPVPIHFNKPTILECKLEYYNNVRENFMLARNFVLSDQETTTLDLPTRTICSSIWRVTVIQKIVKNEDDSENEENEDETSDSVNQKGECSIEDILSGNSFRSPIKHTTVFSPKLFVGCLQVDSFYNPTLIPTAEIILDFSIIQFNFMASLEKGGYIPKLLQNLKLAGDPIPPHKCVTINLSGLFCHSSIFSDLSANFDAETELNCDTIDYSSMTYQPLIENFKTRAYIEHATDVHINLITNTLHLQYGQSVSHALSVLKRIFDDSQQDEHELVLMTRYIICNNTSSDLKFSQFGTDDIHDLPARSFYLYSLHTEMDEKKICIEIEDNKSVPFDIDHEGTTIRMLPQNYIFIVNVQSISSFQKKITITGHVEFYNMTINSFMIQYKVYRNTVDTERDSIMNEVAIDAKQNSAVSRCIEGDQESIRMKFTNELQKGWSGEIPLKEVANKPWLVKVPAANRFGELCFWVRIIRENIEEFRISKAFCPQRVLVIIWPLFTLKSNLTVHTTAFEETVNQNYSIFGRGEVKEMQLQGTFEDEHHLSFKMDFKSIYDEDKRQALLSYKLIDMKQFFQIPAKYNSIETAIKALQSPEEIHWPCYREEEMRWSRENTYQESTLPIYKCGPTQEFSCSLQLKISPWCLVINSTGCSIRLKNNKDSALLEPNNVVMPFSANDLFQFEVKILNNWFPGGMLHLNTSQKLGPDSYLVPEEGMVPLTVRNEKLIANFVLHSLREDNMRVLILTTGHVVVNYTEFDLNFWSFAIQTNERSTGLKFDANMEDTFYTTDKCNLIPSQIKGTPITLFSSLASSKTKYKSNTTYNYFITLFNENPANYSCPILLNRKFKRKSFSVLCGDRYVPFITSIIRHQDQLFFSIYEDQNPIISVQNLTDFNIFVAQSSNVNPGKTTSPAEDCPCDDRFQWYQQVPAKQLVYYTPPIIDETFPEIDIIEFALIFACVSTKGTTVKWSRVVKIDESKEVFLDIPLYGDIKVSVNTAGKTTKVVLDYIRQDTEFSAKDIRARLSNSPSTATPPLNTLNSLQMTQSTPIYQSSTDITSETFQTRTLFDKMTINSYIEGIHITLFTNCDKKSCAKREILIFNLDDVTFRMSNPVREIHFTFGNFQADNQLFETGEFDFPVIICPQHEWSPQGKRTSVYELQKWINTNNTGTHFGDVKIELYEDATDGVKSIEIKLKPLRAYIEDSYIMELVDYLSDCLGTNSLYASEPIVEKERCDINRALVPREVQILSLIDSKTIRLKILRVHALNVLLSVHTCLRVYIALDHSPLDFSMYELADVNTLSENLSASASMHYLSGAIFGAGWVLGSLEILGSPSGLVRTLSTGLRDFVSMPVQGIFNGPWGFLVGITQGSTSLVRNITAGTVNSITKLAASLARNLDRLTLDTEHVQRTDAIRRIRPEGITQGFTQGLTGLGISLLGALGGLAHHPLQANSPVQVVTGFGKGIVGAVAKPISGAAELVALTGQGVLQSVGYNSLPSPRSLDSTEKGTHATSTKFLWKQLPVQFQNEQVLFTSYATLRTHSGFKTILVTLLRSVLLIFDAKHFSPLYTFHLPDIRISLQNEDASLVIIQKEELVEELDFHDEFHVSPRTIQYVQETLSQYSVSNATLDLSIRTDDGVNFPETPPQEDVHFYMEESHAKHLCAYVKLLKRYALLNSSEFSPYG